MKRSVFATVAVTASMLGALSGALGCAHEDPMMVTGAKPVAQTPRPAWVDKGSGAYPDQKGKIFAVGLSPAHMDDEGLAREAADNDGRVQMQRIFDIYIAALLEQYKRYTGQGTQGKTEIDVKSVSRSLTEGSLHGSVVSDHWQNAANGTWYSLVVVDLAAFKEFVAQSKDLDASLQSYIRDNADSAQDDLSKHLAEKHGGQ